MTGIEVITTASAAPGNGFIILAAILAPIAVFVGVFVISSSQTALQFAATTALFAALVGGAIWSGVTATHQKEDYVAAIEKANDDTAAALEDHYDLDLATELPTTTGTTTTDLSATDRTTGALLNLTAVTRDGRITLYGDDAGSRTEYSPAS